MKLKIILIACTLLTWGCSDFLEESSQDEVRPSTVADMVELLNGEALPGNYDYWENMTGIFTDDMKCAGNNSGKTYQTDLNAKRLKFGWQIEMFDAVSGNDEIKYWEYPYQKILGCNAILDYIDKVTGEQAEKDNLRGEVYALRGYYYLMLVNFFGQAYNVGDPEKNLAVPLKLTMDVTEDFFPRNTVAEVYRSIEKDLKEADRLLEANPLDRGTFHMDHLSAKALLSRMYLYMENWDQCIEYAEKVLAVKPDLLNLANLSSMMGNKYEGVYNANTPVEILWRFSEQSWGAGDNLFDWMKGYIPSDELLASYDSEYFWDPETDVEGYKGDLRMGVYFDYVYDRSTWDYIANEFVKDRAKGTWGIRNAELYVNLAEAYTRKFMAEGNDEFRKKALDNLNYLRKHRYDDSFVEVDIQDANELYEFCKAERRRELCGESNHRWFDLRRWGQPALKHVWFLEPGEVQEFFLSENSPRYVLQIPSRVMEYNRELVQNP